ncbi:hypothetical protein [Komarekiella delphini-convector]|uniref:hypothetical protein n=1 Tax=Komarekiella delphini-convector TaxID=3050158 RepID=UPI001780856B|nr:hypothetical protein [Komarekiella delphini-convector]
MSFVLRPQPNDPSGDSPLLQSSDVSDKPPSGRLRRFPPALRRSKRWCSLL